MKSLSRSPRTGIGLVLLACLSPAAAHADDASHRCASTPLPAQRLACYDAAFPPPPAVREVTAAQAVRDFGLTRPAVPLANPGQPVDEVDPDRITGRVTDVVHAGGGRRTVVLENGQRWSLEPGTVGHIATGDTVELRKGALGAFLLRTQAGVSIRARRAR